MCIESNCIKLSASSRGQRQAALRRCSKMQRCGILQGSLWAGGLVNPRRTQVFCIVLSSRSSARADGTRARFPAPGSERAKSDDGAKWRWGPGERSQQAETVAHGNQRRNMTRERGGRPAKPRGDSPASRPSWCSGAEHPARDARRGRGLSCSLYYPMSRKAAVAHAAGAKRARKWHGQLWRRR